MKTIIHKANSRGVAEHGWLHSKHTFSFANYYNPERMGFGTLRVLNDDIIEAGSGFGTHPHNNMEIISIPIFGELRHEDSMGNCYVIRENEVQLMSAGTGITHSEYNNSESNPANFLQIWISPKHQNIEPRYEQSVFSAQQKQNCFLPIIAPEKRDGSLKINQDAWLALGNFDTDKSSEYKLHKNGNGLYVFVIDGRIKMNNIILNSRDAIGITDTDRITIEFLDPSKLLTIEVPMSGA